MARKINNETKKEMECCRNLLADANKFTYFRAVNIGRLAAAVLREGELKEKTVLGEKLIELVEALEEKQSKVLLMRFGLCEEFPAPVTLQRVGEELEMSRQRAFEIEKKAIRNLRPNEWSAKDTFYIPILEKKRVRAEKGVEIDSERRAIIERATAKGLKVSEEDWNTVEDLGLSTKAYNAVTRYGVKSILGFKLISFARLLKQRGVGEKIIQEISEKRRELGVPLK